jgi:hypothetical protein
VGLIKKIFISTFKISSGNTYIYRLIKSLCVPDDYSIKYTQKYFKPITEYIQNMDRDILNAVYEIAVRRLNKRLETGGEHFEHYL